MCFIIFFVFLRNFLHIIKINFYKLVTIDDLLLIEGSLPNIFDLNNSGLSLLLRKPSFDLLYVFNNTNRDLTYLGLLGSISPNTYVKQFFEVKDTTQDRLHWLIHLTSL